MLVLDLERPIAHGIQINTPCRLDLRLPYFVVISSWVCFLVLLDWQALLLHQGILVSVNSWVDAQTKDVLVILGQGAGGDDVAPSGGLVWGDVDNGDDTGGTDFDFDASGLVEFEGEDVFVVGECDCVLDYENAPAG